jgi:uncharacterized protein
MWNKFCGCWSITKCSLVGKNISLLIFFNLQISIIMNYKLSHYIVTADLEDNNNTIVHSTKSGISLILNKSIIDDLKNQRFSQIDESLLGKIISSEIIVPERVNEIEQVIEEFTISKNNKHVLGFVITPSANCQLGCNYCGQEHSDVTVDKNLSENILKHIKTKLEKHPYRHLEVTWYGAEPLMGFSAMKKLSNEIIELTESRKITYSASIITNALSLKKKIFNDLVLDMKVKNFQITLDGIKETHDNSRFTKKGLPTFDIIVNNIKNAVAEPIYIDKNVNISIRMNVHKNNYMEVESLLDMVYEENLHKKVSVDFAPIHDWGLNKANESVGLSPEKFAELEIDWFMKMRKLGFRDFSFIPTRIDNTCMTTTDDSELIDATGKISYCWEVPYTPSFDNDSEFIIGNVNDSQVYDSSKQLHPLRDWYNDMKTGENNSDNCKNCNFLPVCGGHCPISWYKGVAACPPFKKNMEDRLVLQYLIEKEAI